MSSHPLYSALSSDLKECKRDGEERQGSIRTTDGEMQGSSAEEALIVAQTLNPHVVLTDLRMHKMDGMKLMEKLRSEKDAPEVIIMSAFGTPYMIEELLKKGAFSFMEKPLEKNRMLHHINSALEIATKMKPTAERAKGDQRAADVLPSGTIAGIAS